MQFSFNSEYDYAAGQIIGSRYSQEDYLGFFYKKEIILDHFAKKTLTGKSVLTNNILAVVADGMGGAQAGDIASQIAVNSFIQSYTGGFLLNIKKRLHKALDFANTSIARYKEQNNIHTMGCTLLAVAILDNHIHWISVGDTILWLFREKELHRLNADHSYGGLLDELVEQGLMDPLEAANAYNRNALTSALVGESIEKICTNHNPLPVHNNDYLLLATDGILSLKENELAHIMNKSKTPAIIRKKVFEHIEKRKHPRQDNTSIQILHFHK